MRGKWVAVVVVLGVLWLAGVLGAPEVLCAQASGCGLKPLKPLTPLGCKDLVPQCQCDLQGRHCAWVWVCVSR